MLNTHSLDLEAGSSQYAQRADNANLSILSDLSIETWIKLESAPATPYDIVSKYDSGLNKRSYRFAFHTDSKLSFVVSNDGTSKTAKFSTTAFSTSTWTHAAVTYNAGAGTCAFYLNGVADGTGSSLDTSIHDNDTDFIIGAEKDSGVAQFFLDGLTEDVRLWNDIRTAQEIAAFYNKQLRGNETNLVGYWKLNNSYVDETTNAQTLTAIGSPVFSTDVPFVGRSFSGSLI